MIELERKRSFRCTKLSEPQFLGRELGRGDRYTLSSGGVRSETKKCT